METAGDGVYHFQPKQLLYSINKSLGMIWLLLSMLLLQKSTQPKTHWVLGGPQGRVSQQSEHALGGSKPNLVMRVGK